MSATYSLLRGFHGPDNAHQTRLRQGDHLLGKAIGGWTASISLLIGMSAAGRPWCLVSLCKANEPGRGVATDSVTQSERRAKLAYPGEISTS